MKPYSKLLPEQKRWTTWLAGLTLAFLLGGALLIAAVVRLDFDAAVGSRLCNPLSSAAATSASPATQSQLRAILHYATSKVVPQQSLAEIRVTLDVVMAEHGGGGEGFNFLVFGLGHDSVMWESFNSAGTTVFLEEDPKWVHTVLKDNPHLRAHHVNYRTQLQQADDLLSTYRSEARCEPDKAVPLRGNTECRLALDNLPDEVYDKEWDLIMIDAPRGYFAEAPGRMAAIFSAAVMARHRRSPGPTHVFLHDVNRRVEKIFAQEFLCRKYLVNAVGRLWHFRIPSAAAAAANVSQGAQVSSGGDSFCYIGRGLGNDSSH